MHWLNLDQYARARHHDVMHAVEQQRRVSAAQERRPQRLPTMRTPLGRALVWLGQQLITWGGRVQLRGRS